MSAPRPAGHARPATADPAGVWITPYDPATVGPGVPLAVKDLFDTAGVVTTYGSAVFADHVPTRTAEAVLRLEAAGYAAVGKTNLHEFAYGTTTENAHYGSCPNPAAPGRVAGGSSGGSAAALVLGSADAALGTDSGGSIRIPAACCGVVGFKPTFGLVPLDGCWPLAPSFDHAGPLARNVPGCLAMMRALVPGWAPVALDWLGDVRVGTAWLDSADFFVRDAVERACSFVPGTRPLDFPRPEATVGTVFMREAADVHRELFAAERDLYSEELQSKLDRCLAVTDRDAAEGEAARAR
jgi:aspartyl-tRNA(Asn)/glutamyl-tRNA(Gln) amidotransferase subunit A